MPISRRQFDLGIDKETDDWITKIHQFLSEHKDEAYSEDEIRVKLNLKSSKYRYTFSSENIGDSKTHFKIAIDTLVESGAIGKKEIQGINYYIYIKPIDHE